ncbi:MAG TPA: M55 family metallopeptidase [Gaiellales bacterium]|nr:M55 family metallopeptidase [Gaiellales bacterium]
MSAARVYLSTDIEGTAGIVDWGQVLGPSSEYEVGRRLLLAEINAAIDGAGEAGAADFLVNDAHATMANLPPAAIHREASYLSGRYKPLYMMEGLDQSFDAAFFIAYHGSIGHERAILAHTYNPGAIWEVKLNGAIVGESALNALVALHHGVPVALVTGDQATADEARTFAPAIEAVVVKRSVSRFAAESLHPRRACELIQAGARAAIGRLDEIGPPQIDLPATLDITFLTADMAEAATAIRGVVRSSARSISVKDDDPLQLYRTFVTIVALTRGVEG